MRTRSRSWKAFQIICVDDIPGARQLIEAAKGFGNIDKLVTAQETLLAPVAEANEALGLEAMSSEVVARTLDKSKLKATLKRAGITTPRDELVTTLKMRDALYAKSGFRSFSNHSTAAARSPPFAYQMTSNSREFSN